MTDEEPKVRATDDISYAQFRSLANSMPNMAWIADPDGWVTWYNQRWYDYTGTVPEEMTGWGWQSVHHPDVLPEMLERWTTALRTGTTFEMTFPLRRGSDGSFRIFVTRAEPLREDGKIVGWFGTNTDITEQERTRERLQLVINELNHRVKNTLATVLSMAAGTFKNSDPTSLHAFENRIISLAQVHDVLARDSWSAASVDAVLKGSISAFGENRFTLEECDIPVEPRVAAALAMTIHELGTNAVKYGSLSVPEGRVAISCGEQRAGRTTNLVITWQELNGPPVQAPTASGFGVRLIKRAMAGEAGSTVEHAFLPTGVVCTISVPLKERGAA